MRFLSKSSLIIRVLCLALVISSQIEAATGDVSIRLNGGGANNKLFIGQDNILEILITNSNSVQGMSLGFGFASPVTYSIVPGYGNKPNTGTKYVQEWGNATGAFDLGGLVVNSTSLPGQILIGGAALSTPLPAHTVQTLCYSMKINVPAGQTAGGVFCIDNIFFPPAGSWTMDFGASGGGSIAPTFQGQTNTSQGNPTALPVCFDITIACATSSPSYTHTGDQTSDDMAFVSGVGDVNNDGKDDYACAAPNWSVDDFGKLWIRSGATGNSLWTVTGAGVGNRFATSVAGLGDVNKDGHDDFIVGADGLVSGGPGAAYIISGIDFNWLLAPAAGPHSASQFGATVAGGGDINNDGWLDFVVGAPHRLDGLNQKGAVYINSGQNGSQLFYILGSNTGEQFGQSICVLKKLDPTLDSYADMLVGAPGYSSNRGRVIPYYGGPANPGNPPPSSTSLLGENTGDFFGSSVANLQDINGDGTDDFIVGAPWYPGGVETGRAYVYSGKTRSIIYTKTGEAVGNQFGISVAGIGDISGDGTPDFAVGAIKNNLESGKVYLYSGSNGGLIGSYTGASPSDWCGWSVAGVGDVNGDCSPDIGFGSRSSSTGGQIKVITNPLCSATSCTCCSGTTGNVNTAGIVDLSDLSSLVNYLTGGGYVLPCSDEANVNHAGIVDLSDLSALVNYLTGGGYVLPNCS